MNVVLDVWGGESHMDHVARKQGKLEDFIEIIKREIQAGFIVNIREELVWGSEQNFDHRIFN